MLECERAHFAIFWLFRYPRFQVYMAFVGTLEELRQYRHNFAHMKYGSWAAHQYFCVTVHVCFKSPVE